MTPILELRNLSVHFPIKTGWLFQKTTKVVQAVSDVSLTLNEGETLGLVGESGCGKSTLGRAALRLYDPTAGMIFVGGRNITNLDQRELLEIRPDIQMIFQDPYASLNPRMTVFDIIAEPIRTHGLASDRQALERKIKELMEQVGLSARYVRKYPHEFSGGQRQRIAVARALAMDPKVIVCDEPVSALDVSIQSQILRLLDELKKEKKLAYIFISHDISAVRYIADRIAVMYLGKVVEVAESERLFSNPRHPYTRALLSAVPVADPIKERNRERLLLTGDIPSPINPPAGCSFHTRCPFSAEKCRTAQPSPVAMADEPNHVAACMRLDEI